VLIRVNPRLGSISSHILSPGKGVPHPAFGTRDNAIRRPCAGASGAGARPNAVRPYMTRMEGNLGRGLEVALLQTLNRTFNSLERGHLMRKHLIKKHLTSKYDSDKKSTAY
jgi:hypothetical protein